MNFVIVVVVVVLFLRKRPLVLCHANCSWRKTFKQPLIDVLKNFAIFIGKKLCWSLYFIKFQDWRPAFLFKMRLRQQTMLVFFCEYSEVFKNSFLIGDVFIIPIGNLYLGIDHWCFRVIFYYCKIRPRNRKNFATDQSKSFAIFSFPFSRDLSVV